MIEVTNSNAEDRPERLDHLKKRTKLLKIVSMDSLKRAYEMFKDKKCSRKYHRITYEALRMDGYTPNIAGRISKELCSSSQVNVIRGMFNYYKDVVD